MERSSPRILALTLLTMIGSICIAPDSTAEDLALPADGVFTDGFETLSTPPNQLLNPGFETTYVGGNPPYDPPTDWLAFGAEVPYVAVGYSEYATQADDTPIYNPSDPGDQSNLFPGYMDSRALKMWGRSIDAGGDTFKHTLGTIYQEFTGGTVPGGAKLTLKGWAYVSSVDPLGADNNVYLVIKCFPPDYSAELCGGGGGMKSDVITSATTADTWIPFSVTVESLDASATVVQAAMEFEQCASGACPAADAVGSVFWDEIYFSWE